MLISPRGDSAIGIRKFYIGICLPPRAASGERSRVIKQMLEKFLAQVNLFCAWFSEVGMANIHIT